MLVRTIHVKTVYAREIKEKTKGANIILAFLTKNLVRRK